MVKYAFVDSTNNKFTYGCICEKVQKEYVDQSQIVLFHDKQSYALDFDIFDSVKKLDHVYDVNDISKFDFSSVEKVFFLSLSTRNAGLIEYLLERQYVCRSKIYILVTDDEVDRWNKIYERYGSLCPCKKMLVDDSTILVLEQIENFICLFEPWGSLIKKVLGRDVNVFDFNAGFFPENSSLIENNPKQPIRHLAVLFGAKPNNWDGSVATFLHVVFFLIRRRRRLEGFTVDLGVWEKPLRYFIRNPVHLFLSLSSPICRPFIIFLGVALGFNVNFIGMRRSGLQKFLKNISKFDFLVLSKRGSIGGARCFIRLGGVVIYPEKSLNYRVFSNFEFSDDLLTSQSVRGALEVAFESLTEYSCIAKKYQCVLYKYVSMNEARRRAFFGA